MLDLRKVCNRHALLEVHDLDAGGDPAEHGDRVDFRPYHDPLVRDDEDLVAVVDAEAAHELAGLLDDLVALDAHAAAALELKVFRPRPFAETFFGELEHVIALGSQLDRDDLVAFSQHNAPDAHRAAARRPDILLRKANAHALARRQNNILAAARKLNSDQLVALAEGDRLEAVLSDVGKRFHRRPLDRALAGRKEDVLFLLKLPERQDCRHVLLGLQLQQVDEGRASGRPARLRDLKRLDLIRPPLIGQEEQIVVVRRHHDVFHVVIFDRLHAADALAAAVLRAEVLDAHPLDVPEVRRGDDRRIIRHEIFVRDLAGRIGDLRAAVVAVLVGDLLKLIANDPEELPPVRQNAL